MPIWWTNKLCVYCGEKVCNSSNLKKKNTYFNPKSRGSFNCVCCGSLVCHRGKCRNKDSDVCITCSKSFTT
eukprot:UN16097